MGYSQKHAYAYKKAKNIYHLRCTKKHNRLIVPYNKKESSFFEENVVIICVCAFFVVSLQKISKKQPFRFTHFIFLYFSYSHPCLDRRFTVGIVC